MKTKFAVLFHLVLKSSGEFNLFRAVQWFKEQCFDVLVDGTLVHAERVPNGVRSFEISVDADSGDNLSLLPSPSDSSELRMRVFATWSIVCQEGDKKFTIRVDQQSLKLYIQEIRDEYDSATTPKIQSSQPQAPLVSLAAVLESVLPSGEQVQA